MPSAPESKAVRCGHPWRRSRTGPLLYIRHAPGSRSPTSIRASPSHNTNSAFSLSKSSAMWTRPSCNRTRAPQHQSWTAASPSSSSVRGPRNPCPSTRNTKCAWPAATSSANAQRPRRNRRHPRRPPCLGMHPRPCTPCRHRTAQRPRGARPGTRRLCWTSRAPPTSLPGPGKRRRRRCRCRSCCNPACGPSIRHSRFCSSAPSSTVTTCPARRRRHSRSPPPLQWSVW
mmetsp:Transcript_55216/g.159908  ORF Transcript_55216/g.159908 Transcript_55216/m.159908 type:complete len:229 (+) Transcript_55216:1295-1981(+)